MSGTDWRQSQTAAEVALDIVDRTREVCMLPKTLSGTRGLTLSLLQTEFLRTFDTATALEPGTVVDPQNEALVAAMRIHDDVRRIAEATGGTKSDVITWMRSQFEQAFAREIAAA